MSIPIQPIGAYFDLDDYGFFINPANWSKVPVIWHPVIDRIKKAYSQHYQDQLHSLYLRGSLARGTYRAQVSDIDLVGLVHEDLTWELAPFKESVQLAIAHEFPFIGALELMISGYSENIAERYPALAMVLKTQSICILGEDLTKSIPNYRPDASLIMNLFKNVF